MTEENAPPEPKTPERNKEPLGRHPRRNFWILPFILVYRGKRRAKNTKPSTLTRLFLLLPKFFRAAIRFLASEKRVGLSAILSAVAFTTVVFQTIFFYKYTTRSVGANNIVVLDSDGKKKLILQITTPDTTGQKTSVRIDNPSGGNAIALSVESDDKPRISIVYPIPVSGAVLSRLQYGTVDYNGP